VRTAHFRGASALSRRECTLAARVGSLRSLPVHIGVCRCERAFLTCLPCPALPCPALHACVRACEPSVNECSAHGSACLASVMACDSAHAAAGRDGGTGGQQAVSWRGEAWVSPRPVEAGLHAATSQRACCNATSAPGLALPRPHLRRDWARCFCACRSCVGIAAALLRATLERLQPNDVRPLQRGMSPLQRAMWHIAVATCHVAYRRCNAAARS